MDAGRARLTFRGRSSAPSDDFGFERVGLPNEDTHRKGARMASKAENRRG
jgi:hypothetical protein